MTSARKFSAISGSERQPVRGARLIHNTHPGQTIEISLRLRPKSDARHKGLRSALEKPGFKHVSRAEFENAYGADPADLNQIKKFAQEFGLKVHGTGTELARRTVMLSGTASNLQKAFNVELKEYSHPKGNFRGRVGAISVPADYADIVTGVFGLDNRPQAEPHFRRLPQPAGGLKAHSATASHDPNEVAQIYDYPAADGTGQCIGIIELGGGFRLDDLSNYFSSLNINQPQVVSVSVDGGSNSPSTPDSVDGEVMLDVEVAGAIAPSAKIVVYFAPNTDRGFLDAITTAVHDSTNQPSVISISWGSAESQWTPQALSNFDEAFQAAAAMGVTVCVASGDNGSSDGVNDGSNHVDFPASSSFALGCGGTTLQASNGQIVNETVWDNLQAGGGATGGGVSDAFPLPSWQDGFSVPSPSGQNGGRGVPDVSGDADPVTGYNILVDGENAVFGGTSAVAPLWAALVARINQQMGKPVGFLNPLIYAQAVEASGFHDITQGSNGSFSAAQGWDPCTGLGSPDGARLLAALTGAPPAAESFAQKAGTAQKTAAEERENREEWAERVDRVERVDTADREQRIESVDRTGEGRARSYDRVSARERKEIAETEELMMPEATTRPEALRLLQGDLFKVAEGQDVPEKRGLEVGSNYKLDVFIAPPGAGSIAADQSFPDRTLDWKNRDSYVLQVIFAEPDQWPEPRTGTLNLPRRGRSSTCTFTFSPTKAGTFSGRITLCYRGRVLQTALLNALVVSQPAEWSRIKGAPELRFAVEAVVRHSLKALKRRRRFDASLVLNHTPKQQRTATAVSEHGAFINSLEGILPQLAVVNGLLSQVALNSKAYNIGLSTKRNAKLLCDLAQEGNLLYRRIVLDYIDQSPAAADLRDAEYLQIVSARPDALVPLEFVYEYAPPTPDAPVCPNALQALKNGKCPSGCVPKTSPATHVCPLGFWGLSRVIERHVHDPELKREAELETDGADPEAGRDALARQGTSLLAASKQVPSTSQSQLQKSVQKSWQGTVTPVSKWTQWQAAVQANKPVLLLALPHADGTGSKISLEISGDVIQSIFIDRSYVCSNSTTPPIVLLLGCDVANVASTEAYARNIAIFRQAKAAIVLGTVATVLGADAAGVAAKLVTKLANTAKTSSVRFGEILRQTKREAVAESVMMAMCLVAFGDADWYLK